MIMKESNYENNPRIVMLLKKPRSSIPPEFPQNLNVDFYLK